MCLLLAPAVVMVNQSAPAGKLGAVNGAGQMVASAVRGAAPALCGFVWAATLGLKVQSCSSDAIAVPSLRTYWYWAC